MKNLLHMRRFWLAGVVLVATLALLPFSFHAERHLETATRIESSEAGKVPEELATRFHSPFVDRVVLVVQGLPPTDSNEGEQALATIEKSLQEEPGVSGVVSYLDLHDPIFLGKGGGTFLLVGLTSTGGPVESLVPELHERARSLQNQLQVRYPAVKLELTGETPLNFDIRKASSDDVRHAESLVIPATLVLLLVAFGSLAAALIPLAIGQLAIGTALAIAGFLALRWHLSILVQNLSTMLGLGLGIDYALLMVSRFREAIAVEPDGVKAAVIAARQAGRTLLISASTVAIGFLALLTVPISEVRSIGLAGVLVAGMSVLLANTVVPALLGSARSAHQFWPGDLYRKLGRASGRTHGQPLEGMGKGDCRASLARHFSSGRPLTPARLAGRTARYRRPQRRLAALSGRIGSRASHPRTNGSVWHRVLVASDSRTPN